MATRTRKATQEASSSSLFNEDRLDLESLSDEEIEDLLFEEEPKQATGLFNLPTIAGFSLILVGVAYIFQQLGLWTSLDLSVLAGMLPWLAGVLIILLGFGVLSWRPGSRKTRRKKQREKSKTRESRAETVSSPSKRETERSARGRLVKSPDKKLAGVAGGIADYFNIDPTLVRIAFVIGTIASGGPFFLAYILLSFVMPNPEKKGIEERITIIRDS